ncbi:hypothetical protein [Gemmatirosa kalamazoonensis]|uniref:hypothetical protein n=1 Tax=Gemmatirosa kalamazoonensis TaxID=861299 RepID=UPI00046D1472|nr:hypothetical protein [Gemmatirosa kalamazoonensis]
MGAAATIARHATSGRRGRRGWRAAAAIALGGATTRKIATCVRREAAVETLGTVRRRVGRRHAAGRRASATSGPGATREATRVARDRRGRADLVRSVRATPANRASGSGASARRASVRGARGR